MNTRHTERFRILRKGHGMTSLGGQSPDLFGGQLGIKEGEDATGDEPVGVSAAPLVHVPIVVGLDHDLVYRSVRPLIQYLTRKPGPCRAPAHARRSNPVSSPRSGWRQR